MNDLHIATPAAGNGAGVKAPARDFRQIKVNYFPGPRPVLDVSHELHLTHEQMKQTRTLFNAMKKEAAHFGSQLIEKERELDRRFADENIDERTLDELVAEISVL